MHEYKKVLTFWFSKKIKPYWFKKNKRIDAIIKRRFYNILKKAKNGELDKWKESPKGRLALIIVLDQFSRNIYRDNKKAFASDKKALYLTMEGLKNKDDKKLNISERSFFYMPLMHSEGQKSQKESIKQFRALEKLGGKTLKWAIMHKKIIDKYHRFPHRNVILGKKSTKKELAYLSQPGSGF
jgi:uncharacterized protein (DUF924 family)